jgi:hypothetical protein
VAHDATLNGDGGVGRGRFSSRSPNRQVCVRDADRNGQSVRLMRVSRLQPTDVSLVAAIDRSEHVDVQYRVIDGELREFPAAITDIAGWDPTGTGPHSVAAEIAFCSSVVAHGGILLGAFDAEHTLGLAIVDPAFEPLLAWLALLHVSRPSRRRGAAQALWNGAVDIAVANGAESIYVSATPTESAVGFYLRQGCRLADPVHSDLFAAEPEDIHMVCSLK